MVASSAGLPRRGGIIVRATPCPDPRVDLGQLTLPETTNLTGGQVFVLDPAIDRVLGNAEMFGHLVDRDPGFGHQAFLPSKEERHASRAMDSSGVNEIVSTSAPSGQEQFETSNSSPKSMTVVHSRAFFQSSGPHDDATPWPLSKAAVPYRSEP